MILQSRPQLRLLGKILATGGVLALLLSAVGWESVALVIAGTALPWLVISYAVHLVRRWIDAVQMSLILRLVGLRTSVERVFLANALSTFYDLILPTGIVATAAKWLNLSGATGERPVTLNAVLFNRVVILAPILLLGCLALVWENPFESAALPIVLLLVLTCAGCLAALAYHPRLGVIGDGVALSITARLPKAVGKPLTKLVGALSPFRALRPIQHLLLLVIASCGFLVQVVSMWCLVLALHLDVPVLVLAWALALLSVSRQIPLTIGNLGVREGLLVLALAPYGVNLGAAVALGLLSWTRQLAIAVIGAGYQAALTLGWAQWRSEPPTAAPGEAVEDLAMRSRG